jgi:malate synthase
VSAADLLTVPTGEITAAGLLNNVSVSLQYLAAWLGGNGCVPINHLMEDAATAEIARAQIWQWIHHPAGALADGRRVTIELFRELCCRMRAGGWRPRSGPMPMHRATSARQRRFLMR